MTQQYFPRGLKMLMRCGGTFTSLSLIANIKLSFLAVIFIQLFTSIGQFMVMLNTTTFLTRACGMSDTVAGIMYGIYGMAAFFWSMLGGPIIDRVGFKPVLVMATFVAAIGRVLTSYTANSYGIYITIPVLLAWGDSWISVGLLTATYAHARNDGLRKFMFGITYSIMNVGAVIAATISESKLQISGLGYYMIVIDSVSQSIIFTAALPMLIALLIALFMPPVPLKSQSSASSRSALKEDADSASDSYDIDSTKQLKRREANRDPNSQSLITLVDSKDLPPSQSMEWLNTLVSKDFWRVALVSICLIGSRTIFLHLNATFPTFMRRVYGNNAPIGAMYSINPIIIMALAPLFQLILVKLDTIRFLIVGTALTSLSPLFLAFAAPHQMGLAAIILFAIVLSLGEALWGPLSQFYISQIAGEGRIGTFTSLLTVVTFVPKLPTGIISGLLLSKFCPSDMAIPCHHSTLWFIITGMSITTPLSLSLLSIFKVLQSVDKLPLPSSSNAATTTTESPQIGQSILLPDHGYDDLEPYYTKSQHKATSVTPETPNNVSKSGHRRRRSSASVHVYPSNPNSPRININETDDIRLTRQKRSRSSSLASKEEHK